MALTNALEDDTSYSMDSTIVRGHVQAAGAKEGLKKKHLVVRGEASPVKFTLSQMPVEGRSRSTSRAGKWRTAKRTKR